MKQRKKNLLQTTGLGRNIDGTPLIGEFFLRQTFSNDSGSNRRRWKTEDEWRGQNSFFWDLWPGWPPFPKLNVDNYFQQNMLSAKKGLQKSVEQRVFKRAFAEASNSSFFSTSGKIPHFRVEKIFFREKNQKSARLLELELGWGIRCSSPSCPPKLFGRLPWISSPRWRSSRKRIERDSTSAQKSFVFLKS